MGERRTKEKRGKGEWRVNGTGQNVNFLIEMATLG